MSRSISLRIQLNTTSDRAAQVVCARLSGLASLPLGPAALSQHYEKGHLAHFTIPLPTASWSDHVLAALELAQSLGYGWGLSGAVEEALELSATRLKDTGMLFAQLDMRRLPDRA